MAVSFNQFFNAIAKQESGGNYKAVGVWVKGDRAYGKYQVMGANIGAWTEKYWTERLTPQQFLANPMAQEGVAYGQLKAYFDKYGPEGAAAMWYSGQSNPNKTYGNPPVNVYVRQVMQKAGADSGAAFTGPGGSSGSGSSGGKGTPSIDPATLARDYGFTDAMLKSIPELNAIFKKAVAGGWDGNKFKAAVENSTWWKTHTKSQRDYLIKNFTDPASFQRDRTQMNYKINEIAAQLGITDLMGTKAMNDLTWNMLYNGWSDAELKYHLANILTMSPEGTLGGAGGQFQTQMASTAWANGVRLDQNWYLNWYKQILQGNASPEEAQRWIRNQAAAIFPAFRDQIIAGQNVMDIANPYIQSMGNILEINAGDIDLFDRDVIGALNYKDPKSGATGAKPLWQWEVDLRKDARWLKTNNAREGMMGVAHKVAQDMGVLF